MPKKNFLQDSLDIYNKKKAYTNKIEPLIRELKGICIEEKMPMFIAVAVANNETGTEYIKEIVHGGAGITLKDDRISDIILYLNQFEVGHPKKIQNMLDELEEYARSIATENTEGIPKATDDMIADLARIVGANKEQVLSLEPLENSSEETDI